LQFFFVLIGKNGKTGQGKSQAKLGNTLSTTDTKQGITKQGTIANKLSLRHSLDKPRITNT